MNYWKNNLSYNNQYLIQIISYTIEFIILKNREKYKHMCKIPNNALIIWMTMSNYLIIHLTMQYSAISIIEPEHSNFSFIFQYGRCSNMEIVCNFPIGSIHNPVSNFSIMDCRGRMKIVKGDATYWWLCSSMEEFYYKNQYRRNFHWISC